METILVDIHHDSSKTSVINMDHLQTISPVQTERNIFGQQLPTLLVIWSCWSLPPTYNKIS